MGARYRILAAASALMLVTGGAPPLVSRAALLTQHWYVDWSTGSNNNDCRSRQRACKTIAHAIALSSPGDAVIVAPGVYPENLAIRHSVNLVGAGSHATVIDGRGFASEIITSNHDAVVSVSGMTMRNGGGGGDGGGVYNCGSTLRIEDSIISGNAVFHIPHGDGYGGAIYNCPGGTLTIVNTTIRDNAAETEDKRSL